jgi:RND family efflux transporter MFP subunit
MAGAEGDARRSRRSRALRFGLPVLIVALGVIVVVVLVASEPTLERQQPEERAAEVTVTELFAEDVEAIVEARGVVQPARRVELFPEIAGPVSWVSDALVPGGRFRAGEPMLRIDPSQTQLAVAARRGEVASARVELRREQNRAQLSERAWDIYARRHDAGAIADSDRELALNRPQLAAAEEALESAQSQLAQAQLDLKRTRITAPFDAAVVSEQVDVGQRVNPNQAIATLVGTDSYWVQASVDVDDVPLIEVPADPRVDRGSRVRVTYRSRGEPTARSGRVLRLLTDLDPEGSMARVLIEVDDPLGLEDPQSGPPLLIGAFVDLTIYGRRLRDVFVVPREALREDDEVWLLNEAGRLEMRQVQVLHAQRDAVFVQRGLSDGARLVTSSIVTPVEGMKLVPQTERAGVQPVRGAGDPERGRNATHAEP